MVTKRGHEYGVHHFFVSESALLSSVLMQECALSKSKAQELIHLGSIYVNHSRQITDEVIPQTSYVRAHTTPRRFPLQYNSSTDLIFENDNFLVVHKKSGSPVHDSVDNCRENLLRELEQIYKIPLYITHRLDVPTEGLILYAKNLDFQKHFNQLLQQKKVKKIYTAEVENKLQKQIPDHLIHYMKKSFRAPKELTDHATKDSQHCELKILSQLHRSQTSTDLTIDLITGRTHQIRSQLSFIGHPIIGDTLYCAQQHLNIKKEAIHLTASYLTFESENKKFEFRTETRWSAKQTHCPPDDQNV